MSLTTIGGGSIGLGAPVVPWGRPSRRLGFSDRRSVKPFGVASVASSGVVYTQLERGIRGMNRGIYNGS